MNISKMLRKILLEDDKVKASGLNYNDQYSMLDGVIKNCRSMSGFQGRSIKFINPDKFNMFPEVQQSGVKQAYYVTAPIGNAFYMVFGIDDPNVETPALLAYKIVEGQTPERVPDGLGSQCEQLMNIKDLGKVNLSPQNKAQLDAFIESVGSANVEMSEPENIELYDKYPYANLEYDDGRPVFNPVPRQPGYIWVRKGLKQKRANLPDAIEQMLNKQSFTGDQTKFDITSDSARYGFYLKDIMNDWPALTSQRNALRPRDIMYPLPEILDPTREQCRTSIKKLDYCIKSPVGKDCGVDLFKNKFIALRCGDKKMVGGVIGMKDEYENVMRTGAPYGVADLKRVVGKAQYADLQKESLENKINSILNEQRRKFNF
jgi:hypothetical protein